MNDILSGTGSRQPKWLAELVSFLIALTMVAPLFSQSIQFKIKGPSTVRERSLSLPRNITAEATQDMTDGGASASDLVSAPSLGLVAMDHEIFQVVGTSRSPLLRKIDASASNTLAGNQNARGVAERRKNLPILTVAADIVVSQVSPMTIEVECPTENWSQTIDEPEGISHATLNVDGRRLIVANKESSRIILYHVEGRSVRRVRTLALNSIGSGVAAAASDRDGGLIAVLTHVGTEKELFASIDGHSFERIGAFSESTRLLVDPDGRFLSVFDLKTKQLVDYRRANFSFALADIRSFTSDEIQDPFLVSFAGRSALVGIHNGFIAVCFNDNNCLTGSIPAQAIVGMVPSAMDGRILLRLGQNGQRLATVKVTGTQDIRTSLVAVQAPTQRLGDSNRETFRIKRPPF